MKRVPRRILQIDAARRRQFVLQCRRMGASYQQAVDAAIEEFGIENLPRGWDVRIAGQDVKRALEAAREAEAETVLDVRAIECARLDEMHSRIYPVALGNENIPPDVFAIDRVLKIMARRAAYLGLDAPTRVDFGKMSDEQLLAYVAQAMGLNDTGGDRGDGAPEPDVPGDRASEG